jgi:hypothetical protein
VPIDLPAYTPRLSVAYTLSNHAPPAGERDFFDNRSLYVSTSQSITNSNRLAGRADATVELRDASGQVVEQFRPRGRGGYGGSDSTQGFYVPVRGYVGQPGQRYTLRASAPGVESVEAALTLPAAAAATEGGRYTLSSVQPNYQYQGRLTFSIRDNAATTDYYLAYGRVFDAAGRPWGEVVQDYGARNGLGPEVKFTRLDLSRPGSTYQTLPISDAGRQGQRLSYSEDVYLSGYRGTNSGIEPAFIEVIVSSIPADTYEFYQSIQRYYDTEGNPFAEPAPLRSNVPGGYGLFGGATDATLRVPI